MTCNWNSFGLVYGGCPEFPPTWGRSSDGFGAFCAPCTGTPRYRGAALTPPSGLWKPQRFAHLKARLVFLPPPPRGLPINALVSGHRSGSSSSSSSSTAARRGSCSTWSPAAPHRADSAPPGTTEGPSTGSTDSSGHLSQLHSAILQGLGSFLVRGPELNTALK